jgi:hypothetical protein
MTPANSDDILIQAFAAEGFAVSFVGPTTLSVSLPDVSDFKVDIGEWYTGVQQVPPAILPELAAEFAASFGRGFRRSSQRAAALDAVYADIEKMLAEETLRVRIYPEDALAQPPDLRDSLVTRALTPGLVEAVVIDKPDSIVSLPRTALGGKTVHQVMGAALHASLTREPIYAHTEDVFGVPFTYIGETQRYVGSHIHVLSRYVGPAPYGALVSFPLPEYLLVHEIGTVHLIHAMEVMQEVTDGLFKQGERGISAQLYWWQPGSYEQASEQERLASGEVPDLRPVGVEVDREEKSITPLTADAGDLMNRWFRENT